MRSYSRKSGGFTLVELTVVMTVLLVIVATFYTSLTEIFTSSTVAKAKSVMTYELQSAMEVIENDVSLASSFLVAKDADVAEPYAPSSNGGVWSYRGENGDQRALILRSFSTTTHPMQRGTNSRLPVFIGSPSGPECQSQNVKYNDVEEYNSVLFIRDTNLYRRTLVDTSTQYCNPGQYQKLSCPSQVDLTAQGLGTRNAACQADDELLASNVSAFRIDYFARQIDSSALNAYASGTPAATVEDSTTVEITLTLSARASGKSVSSTIVQRFSRLNGEESME